MQRPITYALLTLIIALAFSSNASAEELATYQVPDLSPLEGADPDPTGEMVPVPGDPFMDDDAGAGVPMAYPSSALGLFDGIPVPYAHPKAHLWAGYCDGHDTLVPCGCPPAWASVDALWLQRSGPDDTLLATDGTNDLWNHQFKFDYETGVRVVYGEVVNCTPIEFTYMGSHDWNSNIGVVGDDLDVPPGPDGGIFDNLGEVVFANYASELHSLELNTLQFRSDSLTVLFGVRYIDAEEDFDLLVIDGLNTGLIRITGDNRLLGLQGGGEWTGGNNGWCFSAGAKAGLYLNFAERDFLIADDVQPANDFFGETSDVEIAFASELRVGVTRHLGHGLKLRGGYEVLWITGMTLAAEQLGAPGNPVPAFDVDGEALYDGGYVGLEWCR